MRLARGHGVVSRSCGFSYPNDQAALFGQEPSRSRARFIAESINVEERQ
jgi:hypothetical protein